MLKCEMSNTVNVVVFALAIHVHAASVYGEGGLANPTIPNDRDDDSRYSPSGGHPMSSPSPWEIQEAMLYVNRIVEKYGADGVIPFEGLEHFMENLGLGNLVIKDHGLGDHKTEEGFVDLHPSHDHGIEDSGPTHEQDHHDSDTHNHHDPDDHNHKSDYQNHHESDDHNHHESWNQSHHDSEDQNHRESDNHLHDNHTHPEGGDSHRRHTENDNHPGGSQKTRKSRSLDHPHDHPENQVDVQGSD